MNKYNANLIERCAVSQPPILFLDFDGTISERDVIDGILAEFADERWLEIEAEWVTGKIGSRECLQKQFELVRATPAEMDEFLAEQRLDEGLPELLKFVQAHGITAHIVSDGFSYYIKRLLLERCAAEFPNLLKRICIWANQLIPHGADEWRVEFPYFEKPCADNCATCKPAVMDLVNRNSTPSIFIGDGLSDRFAAQNADVVFAKKKLRQFCGKNNIGFVEYENLGEVARRLEDAFAHVAHHGAENVFDIVPIIVGT